MSFPDLCLFSFGPPCLPRCPCSGLRNSLLHRSAFRTVGPWLPKEDPPVRPLAPRCGPPVFPPAGPRAPGPSPLSGVACRPVRLIPCGGPSLGGKPVSAPFGSRAFCPRSRPPWSLVWRHSAGQPASGRKMGRQGPRLGTAPKLGPPPMVEMLCRVKGSAGAPVLCTLDAEQVRKN